jgi:hypothetical protein
MPTEVESPMCATVWHDVRGVPARAGWADPVLPEWVAGWRVAGWVVRAGRGPAFEAPGARDPLPAGFAPDRWPAEPAEFATAEPGDGRPACTPVAGDEEQPAIAASASTMPAPAAAAQPCDPASLFRHPENRTSEYIPTRLPNRTTTEALINIKQSYCAQ